MARLRAGAPKKLALACVMGSMNLVRPIGLTGVRCAVIGRPGSPAFHSRFTTAALCWEDFSEDTEALLQKLLRFAEAQPEPPVLFYEEDAQLLLVSRHRDRLALAFRFVIADPDLVEDLVDKNRFRKLAERIGLPVPATRRLGPGAGSKPPDLDLRFPLILKPVMRNKEWMTVDALGKALRVESPAALRELWPRLVAADVELLLQELIPGPETSIESYHVYVDAQGGIAGEFAGRKIRTYPESYGHTTALAITDAADVLALGRALTGKLNLRGVAKFDFKRAPDDRLHLLEINPRFNLWHFPGALAGVNLPALVYADLVGLPRPPVAGARAGVRWCNLLNDLDAAKALGMPVRAWLPWALACEAKSGIAWDDPMPVLAGAWYRWISRRPVRQAPAFPAPADSWSKP